MLLGDQRPLVSASLRGGFPGFGATCGQVCVTAGRRDALTCAARGSKQSSEEQVEQRKLF